MSYYDDLVFINVMERRGYREPAERTAHGLHGYGLNFIRNGAMVLVQEGKEHRLDAPCAFWQTGKRCEFMSAPGVPRDQIWVNFLGGRGAGMAAELTGRSLKPYVAISRPDKYYELFWRLERLFQLRSPELHYQMVVLLERLVGMTIEDVVGARPGTEGVGALAAAIREEPLRDWDFHREAARLRVSYSGFREKFRRLSGSPPHEFMLKCRMLRAAALLREGRLGVKEVASLCRFEDMPSFSRMFKRKMGLSPSAWRSLPGG